MGLYNLCHPPLCPSLPELQHMVIYARDAVEVAHLCGEGFSALCAGSRSHTLLALCLLSTIATAREGCFELLAKLTYGLE